LGAHSPVNLQVYGEENSFAGRPPRKVLDAIVHCRTTALGGHPFSYRVVALSVMNTLAGSGSAPSARSGYTSMSPIRGDVKKKFFPFLSEGRRMLWLASSPISVLERLWARRVFRTDRAVGCWYSMVS